MRNLLNKKYKCLKIKCKRINKNFIKNGENNNYLEETEKYGFWTKFAKKCTLKFCINVQNVLNTSMKDFRNFHSPMRSKIFPVSDYIIKKQLD